MLFSFYRMSTASGSGGDSPQRPDSQGPPQEPDSQGPKKSRGPTTGSTSARATQGVPGAKVVKWDPTNQTFYQEIRKENKKVGLFNNRLGALVKAHIPPTTRDWSEVTPQMVAAILSALHSEFRFVYTDPDTEPRIWPTFCRILSCVLSFSQQQKATRLRRSLHMMW